MDSLPSPLALFVPSSPATQATQLAWEVRGRVANEWMEQEGKEEAKKGINALLNAYAATGQRIERLLHEFREVVADNQTPLILFGYSVSVEIMLNNFQDHHSILCRLRETEEGKDGFRRLEEEALKRLCLLNSPLSYVPRLELSQGTLDLVVIRVSCDVGLASL